MILRSKAKINLTLGVKKKLKNGLHNIQSHFCLINLYDIIKINKIKGNKDKIKFKGKFSQNLNNKKNTISHIVSYLRKKNLIKDNYLITIDKRTPQFAGLGGGTSNAVELAKYLIKSKKKINLVKILNKEIGSDSRLFFHNQGFMKNLNTVINFKKFDLFFLLVYPNIKCSTKNIYLKVKTRNQNKKNTFKFENRDIFLRHISKEKNDLQIVVEKKYPIIKRLIENINNLKGCLIARMTGSGSVCFGVFKSKKSAKAALNRIKVKYPKFWMCVAKTI